MANIAKYTDADFQNQGMDVDFDLSKVYGLPAYEVSSPIDKQVVVDICVCELRQVPQGDH